MVATAKPPGFFERVEELFGPRWARFIYACWCIDVAYYTIVMLT